MSQPTVLEKANDALDGVMEEFDASDVSEAKSLLVAIEKIEAKQRDLRASIPSGCDELDDCYHDAVELFGERADDVLTEIENIISRYSPENLAADYADMKRDEELTDI